MKNVLIVVGGILLLVTVYLFWRPFSSSVVELTQEQLFAYEEKDRDYFTSLVEGIRSGGPPKDGIPAVDIPKYETVMEADQWLLARDIVFGVDYEGEVFAVPQRILVWHEIMNETIGDEHVSITYCPLTGTAIGFKSPSPDAPDPTLGVSGKLVNSNLIMYDRSTDSYWPQILGAAIMGGEVGKSLEEFPVKWTTWEQWKDVYPDTRVLSRETGFLRNYNVGGDPYGSYLEGTGYYSSGSIIFSTVYTSDAVHPKTVVVGVRDGDRNAVAIVKDVLSELGEVTVELGGREIVLVYDELLDFYEARYTDTDEWINAFDAMWFAWYAYYPDTQLLES
jgi:hypothetical protein